MTDLSGVHEVLRDSRKRTLLKMIKDYNAVHVGNGVYEYYYLKSRWTVDVNRGVLSLKGKRKKKNCN